MSERVDEFRIIDSTENIFDLEGEYVIPLYQRAFAWEEKQLEQLVEDINDIRDNSNYYIGSLVVSRFENKFEVVDGQQRLTSLYLLLSCLGKKLKATLTFACRDKSNYTLRRVHELLMRSEVIMTTKELKMAFNRESEFLKKKLASSIRKAC